MSLKQCVSGYNSRVKMSNHKRCLHSKSSMFNSSIQPQQKNSTICKKDSISYEEEGDDDEYMQFLTSLRNNSDPTVEDDTDFEHKMFLEHLREDGKSYVLEMIELESNMPIFVKYEGDDVSSDEIKLGSQRTSSIHSISDYVSQKDWTSHTSGLAPGKDNGSLRQKSPRCNRKIGETLMDDSYEVFVNHIRVNGDSMILELENGISVRYEEENEDLTVSEGSTTKSTQQHDELELVSHSTSERPSDSSAYEDDGSSIESHCHGNSSYFSRKLTALLNMPYDPKEHEELWREAIDCKALSMHRELRSGGKTYPTKRPSMSYLDHYPDLAKQIMSADKHRALTLLRGFFFWLKNLSHEGAFRPWVTSAPRYDIIPIACPKMTHPVQVTRHQSLERQQVLLD